MAKDPCSELSKTITELAMHIGARPDVHSLADVTAEIEKLLPNAGWSREEIIRSIVEATSGYAEAQTELQKKLNGLKREARTDTALRKKAGELEQHVRAMTRPAPPNRKASPKEIKDLQKKVASLRKQVKEDAPSVRARIEKQIAEIDRHIAAGTVPEKRTRVAQPADIVSLRRRRDEKRKQMMGADPAKRQRLIQEINALNEHLRNGTVPARTRAKGVVPADLAKLRAEKAELTKKVMGADAATRARLQKRIDELDAHIKAGTVPPKRSRPAAPADIATLRKTIEAKRREADQADPARRQKIRDQIATLEAHLAAGTVPTKAKATKSTPADIAALRKRRADLERKVAQASPEARTAIQQQIKELQRHIDAGTQPTPKGTPPATPADIAKLRAERQALANKLRRTSPKELAKREARIKELEGHIAAGTLPQPNPKIGEVPEQIAILNARRDAVLKELAKSEPAMRAKFEKQIESLTARLEDGVFLPGPKVEPKLSKELERMVYQRDRLRKRIQAEIEALKPLTRLQRAGSVGVEGLNLQRAIMTAIDLSAVLSQGGFHFLSHPVRGVRAMGPMFRALASPAKAHAIEQEILNRPNAPRYARSGLYIAEEGAQLSAREEAFMTSLLDKINATKIGGFVAAPVSASQRAYVTYLNVLRADSFDIMAEKLTRNGQPTTHEIQQIANFVNASTGRGSLKVTDKLNFEQAAPALSSLLFSARYMASRFQLVGLQPILKGTVSGEGSWRARRMIAGEYARFLTGLAVVLGLYALAGGELETDPRSSDFLKIKVGNTRLDPTAGLSQVTVLISRLAYGEIKKANGDISPLFGARKLYADPGGEKVVTDFLRNKLAPLPAAFWHLRVSGKGGDGKPTSLGKEAANMFIPISFGDIAEAMEEHGVPRGTALSLLSFFGLRMQTYDNEVKKLTPRELRELERDRNKQEKKVLDEMRRN